jgi:RNA methyltransferase, TrmH family
MITSRDNEKLKLARKLHDRRWRERLGLFVAEGEDLVDAARAAGIEPVELLVAGENVEPSLLADVSTLGHPPRVIGVFRRDDLPRASLPDVGLALWHVSDPGNVGTLIRAADALGPAFVALSEGTADPTAPKALRASMGALFRVPIVAFDETTGVRIALVARGGSALEEVDLTGPTTFVLGAEREGLPEEVLAACDARATIPLAADADSLNVATAGAIALYELRRRRRVIHTVSSPPL